VPPEAAKRAAANEVRTGIFTPELVVVPIIAPAPCPCAGIKFIEPPPAPTPINGPAADSSGVGAWAAPPLAEADKLPAG